jgi:hypothetical protein
MSPSCSRSGCFKVYVYVYVLLKSVCQQARDFFAKGPDGSGSVAMTSDEIGLQLTVRKGILRLKFQIPSTKFQISSKFQIQMTETKKIPLQGASVLEIGIWILFVIWNLRFGILVL